MNTQLHNYWTRRVLTTEYEYSTVQYENECSRSEWHSTPFHSNPIQSQCSYLGRKPLERWNEGPPVVQLPEVRIVLFCDHFFLSFFRPRPLLSLMLFASLRFAFGGTEQVGLALVRPAYSYWLVAYALTLRGARKLLATRPLARLVPSDELVPLLTGRHPNADWFARAVRDGLREQRSATACSTHCPARELDDEPASPKQGISNSSGASDDDDEVRQEELLVALAVEPPLVEPAWFRGDEKYSSDTEESVLWPLDTAN